MDFNYLETQIREGVVAKFLSFDERTNYLTYEFIIDGKEYAVERYYWPVNLRDANEGHERIDRRCFHCDMTTKLEETLDKYDLRTIQGLELINLMHKNGVSTKTFK